MDFGDLKKIKTDKSMLKTEIDKVPDPLIRKALELKFLKKFTWNQVAARIGGGNTSESLRKMCGRYRW